MSISNSYQFRMMNTNDMLFSISNTTVIPSEILPWTIIFLFRILLPSFKIPNTIFTYTTLSQVVRKIQDNKSYPRSFFLPFPSILTFSRITSDTNQSTLIQTKLFLPSMKIRSIYESNIRKLISINSFVRKANQIS